MKKLILTTLSLCIMALTAMPAAAQEETSDVVTETTTQPEATAPVLHFGYLNYNTVLKAMPAYEGVQAELAKLRETYNTELDRTEKNFTKQFAEYVDGQKSFPENILLKRQKELQQLMEDGLAFKQEAKRLLVQAEAELLQPLKQELNGKIAQLSAERGYAFVLNTADDACPFINPELGTDITAEILEMIKQ